MSYRCSVFNCQSKRKVKAKNIKLYGFPNKQGEEGRKLEWIRFVRSTKPDGDNWEPSDLSVICSAHFAGGKKSNFELSPAYVPTLFPGVFTNTASSDTEASDMLVTNRSSLRKINQKLRQEGKQYFGEKKTADGVQLVVRKAREMGPPCTSPRCLQSPKSRFCHFFTEKERQDIFNQFWTMNLKYRKDFIRDIVDIEAPKRRRCRAEGSKQRTVQYKYHLKKNGKKYQVCKDVFLSTFGMKHWKFRFWLKPKTSEAVKTEDQGQEEEMECDNNEEGEGSDDEEEEEDEMKEGENMTNYPGYDTAGPSTMPHFLARSCDVPGALRVASLSHFLATAVTAKHPVTKNIVTRDVSHSAASSDSMDITANLSHLMATAVTARHPEIKHITPRDVSHPLPSSSGANSMDSAARSTLLATALEGGNFLNTPSVNTALNTGYTGGDNFPELPHALATTSAGPAIPPFQTDKPFYDDSSYNNAMHSNNEDTDGNNQACSSPDEDNEMTHSSEYHSMEDFVQVELKEMEPEVIKCKHCGNVYENQHKLEIHLIQVHFCNICNIKYDNSSQFYHHLMENHIYNTNTCGICSKIIENNIENHMKTHSVVENTNENNTCDNCNSEIINIETHVCPKIFICFPCKSKYQLKQDLLVHIIKDHFKNDRCKLCCRDITVIGVANLEPHVQYCEPKLNSKKSIKPEICMRCHKEFAISETLIEHHKKDHECTHCPEMFDRKDDLIEHIIMNVHRIPGLVCKFCMVSFTERNLFIKHIVKHKQRPNGKF